MVEREPAVAGFFYPSSPKELSGVIKGMLAETAGIGHEGSVIGAVVPHAGYVYSGRTAAISYSAVRDSGKRRFVIAGPNHEGFPPYTATYSSGAWKTPLGSCDIDGELASRFSGITLEDEVANRSEHSVEVQLPFLQVICDRNFSFFPLILGDQRKIVAMEIGRIAAGMGKETVFIASSDLTHYKPEETARKRDMKLIDRIVALDLDGFYSTLVTEDVSACGYGAIAALIHYTKLVRGRMILTGYDTSGTASGDHRSVVGYPSLIAVA